MSPKKISDLPTTAEQQLWSAIAERLRDGPLQALLALHFKAMTVATEIETQPSRPLEKLGELVQLAQAATARFQDFTTRASEP